MEQNQPELGPWSSGICGCFSDVESCCLTCWCPCVAFGRIAATVDKDTTCLQSGAIYCLIGAATSMSCVYSCFFRKKLRSKYSLQESPCSDCCVHFCCEECALCQEYRELKAQGHDMTSGWKANGQVPPTVQTEMKR